MMERYGLGSWPYFPLASGLLTGKHSAARLRTARGSRRASRASWTEKKFRQPSREARILRVKARGPIADGMHCVSRLAFACAARTVWQRS